MRVNVPNSLNLSDRSMAGLRAFAFRRLTLLLSDLPVLKIRHYFLGKVLKIVIKVNNRERKHGIFIYFIFSLCHPILEEIYTNRFIHLRSCLIMMIYLYIIKHIYLEVIPRGAKDEMTGLDDMIMIKNKKRKNLVNRRGRKMYIYLMCTRCQTQCYRVDP